MAKKERQVAGQFNRLYVHMFNDLLKNGGSTYSYEGKCESGIAVGGYAKNKHHIEAKALTGKDLLWFTHVVRRVVEEYEHLLADHNYYIGTWHDKSTSTLFMDVVRVFSSEEAAFKDAKGNKQRLVYSISEKKYLFVSNGKDYGDECHKQLYKEMGEC